MNCLSSLKGKIILLPSNGNLTREKLFTSTHDASSSFSLVPNNMI